jgi:hypothetical protein
MTEMWFGCEDTPCSSNVKIYRGIDEAVAAISLVEEVEIIYP